MKDQFEKISLKKIYAKNTSFEKKIFWRVKKMQMQ